MALVALTLASGCGDADPAGSAAAESAAGRASASRPATLPELFTDRAREAGLDFRYWNGRTGRHYLLEVMGGGAALFDYDGDGDLDLYAAQGAPLDDGLEVLDPAPEPAGDRLFRNDEGRFTDVTEASGIRAHGYGMGVATGDVDNDGRVDLYVTRWGANQLLRNGGGAFTDVTRESGAGDDRWSVAATFFDYDRDGWLDLFVGNYVAFTLEGHKVCVGFGAGEDYCGPAAYPAQPDRLLRNLGPRPGGRVRFEDVTVASGLDRALGPALGVVAADFDGDGWSDLYVANDQAENFLWINRGDGTFVERALLAGCAVSAEGKVEASMGVVAGDVDNDGDLDLFLTHLTGESNTLYLNDGAGSFDDATIRAGLDAASRGVTGFGAAWLDVGRDGWLDLAVANGAVHRIEELHRRGEPFPLQQANQLFGNLGEGAFEELSAGAGDAFETAEVSRGVAAGDVDDDGDLDLVVVNNGGPLRLLINNSPEDQHWLGLRLIGREVDRDMLGAVASLRRAGASRLWRRAHTDGSYASAGDPRLLFGLGDSQEIIRVEVLWPDGGREIFDAPPVDRYSTLRQGTGRAP